MLRYSSSLPEKKKNMWTWTRTIFVLRTSICFWTIRSLQIIMKFHFAFSFSISAKSLSGDVVDRLKVEHEYEYRRKFLCFLFDASLSPWWNDMQLLRRTVRGLARVWECEFDAVPRSNSRGRSVGMWFLATRGETPPSAVRFARDVWTRRFLAVFFFFFTSTHRNTCSPRNYSLWKIVNRNNDTVKKRYYCTIILHRIMTNQNTRRSGRKHVCFSCLKRNSGNYSLFLWLINYERSVCSFVIDWYNFLQPQSSTLYTLNDNILQYNCWLLFQSIIIRNYKKSHFTFLCGYCLPA